MPEPIIQLKDVHVNYGDFKALDGVSTVVMPGNCIVICGPSGSGKSTLSNVLSGKKGYEVSGGCRGSAWVVGQGVVTRHG